MLEMTHIKALLSYIHGKTLNLKELMLFMVYKNKCLKYI